jgi:hypothetical protein
MSVAFVGLGDGGTKESDGQIADVDVTELTVNLRFGAIFPGHYQADIAAGPAEDFGGAEVDERDEIHLLGNIVSHCARVAIPEQAIGHHQPEEAARRQLPHGQLDEEVRIVESATCRAESFRQVGTPLDAAYRNEGRIP